MQQTQSEFDRILSIFRTHLQKTSHYEIKYLPVFGCICIYEEQDSAATKILTPETLCEILFQEIAINLLIERHSRTLIPSKSSKAAKSAIRKRLNPYLRQLPEYRYLLNEILAD